MKGKDFDICWNCFGQWKSSDEQNCGNLACKETTRKNKVLRECAVWSVCDVYGNYAQTDGIPKMRACPNCELLIEHSGGCRHMTCTSPKCLSEQYGFCFVCLSSWKGHGYKICPLAPRQVLVEK